MAQQLEAAKRCAEEYVMYANGARARKDIVMPRITFGNAEGEISLTLDLYGREYGAAGTLRLLAARVAAEYMCLGGEAFVGTFPVNKDGSPQVPEDFEPADEDLRLLLCLETRDEKDWMLRLSPLEGVFSVQDTWEQFDRANPRYDIGAGLVNLIPPADVIADCQDTVSLELLLAGGQSSGLYETISINEGMGAWMRKDEMLREAAGGPKITN